MLPPMAIFPLFTLLEDAVATCHARWRFSLTTPPVRERAAKQSLTMCMGFAGATPAAPSGCRIIDVAAGAADFAIFTNSFAPCKRTVSAAYFLCSVFVAGAAGRMARCC